MKTPYLRYLTIVVITILITVISYEYKLIQPTYVNDLNKVTDSLRLERLSLISENKELNEVLNPIPTSNAKGNEKKDVLEKIYLLEEEILTKARSINDIELVMDKILINSPNLRNFPVLFPIKPGESKISSTFGTRVAPKKNASTNHKGIDYASPKGTPVYAPADGVVILTAKNVKGYGTMIKMKHKFGFETIYGHLSNYIVNTGDTIKMGKVIGYVGNTGVSTGPHLHYEIIKNGININPIAFTFVMEKKMKQNH